MLQGKWFVTGGSGFLARGIYRRAEHENWPCTFTCYSRDEEKQVKVAARYGDRVACILGDVRDLHHMSGHMWDHDGVIHTAAVKFVPEAERNVLECVKVNVGGSQNVIRVAGKERVPKVVGISTDKACQPVNVYGMTKGLMERAFAEANRFGTRTRLVTVRYGNVIGSTGSIIPMFQQQLAEKGRVTVTDPDMTRFWLSIDQAIDLILLAMEQAEERPGAVFIPKCRAMRIGDLADLLAGGAPVDVIGARPGEKMHEALIHFQESTRVEDMGDYYILEPVTTRQKAGQEGFTYSSQYPSAWVTPAEMAALIEDAKSLYI